MTRRINLIIGRPTLGYLLKNLNFHRFQIFPSVLVLYVRIYDTYLHAEHFCISAATHAIRCVCARACVCVCVCCCVRARARVHLYVYNV